MSKRSKVYNALTAVCLIFIAAISLWEDRPNGALLALIAIQLIQIHDRIDELLTRHALQTDSAD